MTTFGFLSTYPPTRCGLATFTESLASAVGAGGVASRIVRVLDEPAPWGAGTSASSSPVVAALVAGDRGSAVTAAGALNSCDVAVIQHEYGIYGGRDGEEVLDVLRALTVPSIAVLHTVLSPPTDHQRELLERVCALASAVVVMARTARDFLTGRYEVDPSKLSVIPHGVAGRADGHPAHAHAGKRALTWGLMGPGKGIEWAIRAMAELRDTVPRAFYSVVGETHPKVLAQQGDVYRQGLLRLVGELGLEETVTLDARYYDSRRLAATIASADVVVLPYDSSAQVTSGVLVEAVAAGIPVVATAFPHAVELLSGGGGIVVPHQHPGAIADGLRTVFGRSEAEWRAAPGPGSATTTWTDVAAAYLTLAGRLIAVPSAWRMPSLEMLGSPAR